MMLQNLTFMHVILMITEKFLKNLRNGVSNNSALLSLPINFTILLACNCIYRARQW